MSGEWKSEEIIEPNLCTEIALDSAISDFYNTNRAREGGGGGEREERIRAQKYLKLVRYRDIPL